LCSKFFFCSSRTTFCFINLDDLSPQIIWISKGLPYSRMVQRISLKSSSCTSTFSTVALWIATWVHHSNAISLQMDPINLIQFHCVDQVPYCKSQPKKYACNHILWYFLQNFLTCTRNKLEQNSEMTPSMPMTIVSQVLFISVT
jgi:hypothetical protein